MKRTRRQKQIIDRVSCILTNRLENGEFKKEYDEFVRTHVREEKKIAHEVSQDPDSWLVWEESFLQADEETLVQQILERGMHAQEADMFIDAVGVGLVDKMLKSSKPEDVAFVRSLADMPVEEFLEKHGTYGWHLTTFTPEQWVIENRMCDEEGLVCPAEEEERMLRDLGDAVIGFESTVEEGELKSIRSAVESVYAWSVAWDNRNVSQSCIRYFCLIDDRLLQFAD